MFQEKRIRKASKGELKEKQPEQHFLVFILLSCVKALCYRPSSLDEFTQSETFLSFTAFVEVLIDAISDFPFRERFLQTRISIL